MILGGRRERKKPGKRKQGRPSDGCGEGGRRMGRKDTIA
jgi:hypothetical protein